MKKLKTRILSTVLAVLMVAALSACGKEKADPATDTPVTDGSGEATDNTDAAGDAADTTGETGAAEAHESANGIMTTDNGVMREELTSIEIADLMGNGINLGNTMEAYGRTSVGVDSDPSLYETTWGMPVTTQEMFDAMKAAGFDSVRIPIAWTNAMNYETGDYTIGEAYLNRVEEIINYALNADMYVVINDHWDGGWWGMFGSATEETRTAAMDLYVSMWTQISERYAEYSDRLIFESANEELGYRLNDTDVAADSGTLDDDACYATTNQINQAFVDTVRSTGGNNANRFLLIAGYGTDIDTTCDPRYQMPTDTAENKLLISVHFYSPSGYCINTSLSSWGTDKDFEDMNTALAKMTQFTEQGYGVIIGEYSVIPETRGVLKEGALDYFKNFLNNCDLYGYNSMLWSCNDIFLRDELKMCDDDLAALYLEHSYAAQSSMTVEEIQAAAQAQMDEAIAGAGEATTVADDVAMAWLMFTSGDWNVQYNVGDVYAPDNITEGTVKTDCEITGDGTYTVALDFTGTAGGSAQNVTFAAVGISNAETLFPGNLINITEILINGEPYSMTGLPYTTSDDGKCSRVNLYNAWVTKVPEDGRSISGNVGMCSPCVIDGENMGQIQTISVTFNFKTAQ